MSDQYHLKTQIELLQSDEVRLLSEVEAQLRALRTAREQTDQLLLAHGSQSHNAGQLFFAVHLLSRHVRLLRERSSAAGSIAERLDETATALLARLSKVSNE